jgi:hypothetical protein
MTAEVEDRVRGLLALLLVVVLLLLLFIPTDASSAVVASAKTLAISVIAFYFGLHGRTPHAPMTDDDAPESKSAIRTVSLPAE